MIKNVITVLVMLSAIYLFSDVFLYYLDCDLENVLPEHDSTKLLALSLSIVSLYLIFDKD
nr:MAG TPA: hypothetical protein [Bacteriophage sp.]